MNKILDFFDNFRYYLQRSIPRYRGYAFYKKEFWKLLKDRITKGYDESVTWSLYYYTAKWIYPRLLLFYDSIDKVGAIPYEYEKEMTEKYLQQGYKYDEHYHRLKDHDAELQMHNEAKERWKQDVWAMCEAFRDMLAEEDDWDQWRSGWNFYCNQAKKHYKMLKTNQERKKYWDSFGFKRKWDPNIQFSVYDFSERLREDGLNRFAQHFNDLWS